MGRIIAVVLGAAASTLMAASPAEAAEKTIKIGALLPLSGPGAYFGAQDKQGIELALERINAAGINGTKLEVQYEDSACQPLPATQAAKRLIEEAKPDIIVGEECSDATLAVMPLVAQAHVPLLNAGSSSIKVTDPGNPWTFRIMPNEVMQGEDLAKNAVNQIRAKTAVVLHENTNAGIGNADIFEKTFTKLGGTVLANIGFGRDVNDFTAIATRIAGLGAVDVIPTYTLEGQGLKITQALAQAGITKGGGGKAIQIATIWLPQSFDPKAGKTAEGYIRIVQFDPNDQRPIVRDFVKAFEAKYHEQPTHLNAHAWDQILLIADVMKRGGHDPQSIRDTLAATKGFEGVTGTVTFDEHNQNISMDTVHYVETQPDASWKVLTWN
jgi:branched-chain amino acid transport system substrate-binding protein